VSWFFAHSIKLVCNLKSFTICSKISGDMLNMSLDVRVVRENGRVVLTYSPYTVLSTLEIFLILYFYSR
jgi:hypothetical protein